ncbi:DNA-3-methyladenine glycosylase family protein [Millisia brevis]|uniref:DNA-3-methyladenine glycosylase family protein n=1 Tax=Millisia brevis TaxID=264148 RepID=UPI000835DBF5|nr:AlkA N-terminal domain-containing protein [Millisia brevis]
MPDRQQHAGPIDSAGLLGWFRARAVPGMEAVGDRSYVRTVRTDSGTAGIAFEFTDDGGSTTNGPTFTVHADTDRARSEATVIARRLFDLDADTAAVDAALSADPVLARLVAATPGIRVPGAAGLAEILVRAIVGQQVTVAAARGQLTRLVIELGEPAAAAVTPPALRDDPTDPRPALVFPTAATIAEHGGRVIRGPRARIDTVIGVCAAIADGSLTVDDHPTVPDLIDRLTALRGIGPWTADYVAMRLLGAPDILVRKDVALLRGARALGLADSFGELTAAAARFAPWRSYLSMHLWAAST